MAATNASIEAFFAFAEGTFTRVTDALMKDGSLAAAGRRGLDELGQALKAFPDSVHAYGYGSLGQFPAEHGMGESPEHGLGSPGHELGREMENGRGR